MGIAVLLRQFLEGELEKGTSIISDEGINVEVLGERTLRLDGDEEHCTITYPVSLFQHHTSLKYPGSAE